MKRSISIQLKAALLLIVFSTNTVIGFACAMGVDMGFNSRHHHNEEEEVTEAVVHAHADGKQHQQHHEAAKHHHDSNEDPEKAGCCNDGVIKFQSLDKSLTQNTNITVNDPAFVAILSSFFYFDIFQQPQVYNQKHIALFFHPPPPDIRILIQSFQI